MVAGSRNCKLLQTASQVNSHSNRYRPARPIRSLSEGLARRLETSSQKAGALSASSRCSPARAGRPSAPSRVETTGTPAAHASIILTRVPLPAKIGTMATLARASSVSASATGPDNSIRGSPLTNFATACGFLPINRQTRSRPACPQVAARFHSGSSARRRYLDRTRDCPRKRWHPPHTWAARR